MELHNVAKLKDFMWSCHRTIPIDRVLAMHSVRELWWFVGVTKRLSGARGEKSLLQAAAAW